MIQSQSCLDCIDNSGARQLKCIRVLNKSKTRKPGLLGSKLSVILKLSTLKEKKKVQHGKIYPAKLTNKKKKIQKKRWIYKEIIKKCLVSYEPKKDTFSFTAYKFPVL